MDVLTVGQNSGSVTAIDRVAAAVAQHTVLLSSDQIDDG
jgi:hypothetical protein